MRIIKQTFIIYNLQVAFSQCWVDSISPTKLCSNIKYCKPAKLLVDYYRDENFDYDVTLRIIKESQTYLRVIWIRIYILSILQSVGYMRIVKALLCCSCGCNKSKFTKWCVSMRHRFIEKNDFKSKIIVNF